MLNTFVWTEANKKIKKDNSVFVGGCILGVYVYSVFCERET